jgi:2-dehydro-3-deoxyphosphogluconate aldolase / (4S)-4-hydroxy-2-oxoglutarate aldolase
MSDTVSPLFAGSPLMAIFRHQPADRVVELAVTAWDLGIRSVEVPLQSDEDLRGLRAVAELARERGVVVGAGTIIDPEQVTAAIDAGAGFVVSPGLDPAVVRAAQKAGVPIIPGVATPSEVQIALSLDLTWVKAFPAQWLGVDWFKHIRGPFPQVKFVATGGMNAGNAKEFLAAGVSVVAVGSALEDPTQLELLAEIQAEYDARV